MKLNAKELRDLSEGELDAKLAKLKRHSMYLILENVYDTYNVGGLFRLADSLAIKKMYLCGQMDIPPNHKIKKASIGTYKVVPWEYKKTAAEAIEEIRTTEKDCKIYAVEQSDNSVPYQSVAYTFPVGLIVGNETYGVLPETMKLADETVEIPMWGINKSLNVIVSAAIVSYWVMEKAVKKSSGLPA